MNLKPNPNFVKARNEWIAKQISETWFPARVIWLFCNAYNYSNPELAARLGLRLTTVRNKIYELGLQKSEIANPWTPEMIAALKSMYKTKGDVEIANLFLLLFPDRCNWTKQHISKKRLSLNPPLRRTEAEWKEIRRLDCFPGGRSFTILKNSSSINLHDTWVVQRIAWRNKELQKEILENYPELIQAYRAVAKLRKQIKEIDNATEKIQK